MTRFLSRSTDMMANWSSCSPSPSGAWVSVKTLCTATAAESSQATSTSASPSSLKWLLALRAVAQTPRTAARALDGRRSHWQAGEEKARRREPILSIHCLMSVPAHLVCQRRIKTRQNSAREVTIRASLVGSAEDEPVSWVSITATIPEAIYENKIDKINELKVTKEADETHLMTLLGTDRNGLVS